MVNGVCVKDSINKFEADTVEKFPTEHGFVDDLLECRADRVLDFVEVGNTMGGIHEVLSKKPNFGYTVLVPAKIFQS